jgi:hypothetical protein
MKHSRNPYGKTRKRAAALAWLKSKGIDQPRALYPVRCTCKAEPRAAHRIAMVRNIRGLQ